MQPLNGYALKIHYYASHISRWNQILLADSKMHGTNFTNFSSNDRPIIGGTKCTVAHPTNISGGPYPSCNVPSHVQFIQCHDVTSTDHVCASRPTAPQDISGAPVWVKKIPPWIFLTFSPNSWEYLFQILHAYYAFPSTLDYKFLFNCPQLWQSYAIF